MSSGSGDLRRTVGMFRRFSAGQRRVFTGAVVLLAFEAAAAIGIPNLLGWLINFLQDEEKPLSFAPTFQGSIFKGTILVVVVALVVITALNSLCDSLAEISLAKAGRTLGYNIRVKLFGHLQKLSLAFHVRRRTGDVLTRITSDVTALEEFMVKSMGDLVGSVLLIVGTLGVMMYTSVPVSLLALCIVPLLAVVSNWFARRIKSASKVLRAREGDLASGAQEMLSSIGVVQTYGRGAYEEGRFAAQSRSAMDAVLRTARLDAMFSFTVSLLEAAVLAGTIWIGAVVIGEPTLKTGTLVALLLMMDQMFKPTKRIIKEWNTVAKVYASVERIGDLLDREPAVQDAPDAAVAPPMQGHIEFRDVSFAYRGGVGEDTDEAPTRLALDSLSFTITPGEVVALVGHSGAGKSTIAQLLPRLYDPHAGAVLVDGMDVRTLTIESLRAQVGMVLQETVLFSGTIAENIGYGREGATREEIVTAAMQANAHDFISALPEGYDTVLGERAATLSGGQRQRLSIARAFVRGAPILVLDEPTTGLDAESSDLVMQGLMTLLRGKTAVVISHDFKLMELADRVLVMSAGRILEEGKAEDLLARGGLYADLHARQFGKPVEAAVAPVAPATPAAAAVDGDGEPAPMRRREFETVLLQAVPLPASPEAFQLLTGHPPPIVVRGGAEQSIPTQVSVAAGQRRKADPVDELDPLLAPALARDLPGLAEALDADAMAPRLQSMLADGWTVEWCTPGKALVEPGEGCSLRYKLGLRHASSGRMEKHLVGGRMFLDPDSAQDWLRRRLAPLAGRAAGRADLAAFDRTVDLVASLRLALHVFPIDPELPGLLDATDPDALRQTLAATLANPVEGLVLQACTPEVVQYARRGRCVLRYELLWSLGVSSRTLKQVVYGKVYGDDQGASVGPAVAAVHALLGSHAGARFLVPRFQGYLPDLRLALLEALPGTPQVPHLVRDRVNGVAQDGDRDPTLEAALDTCARIAAALHTGTDRLGPTRTLADELAAVRAELALLDPFAPALVAALEEGLTEPAMATADTPAAHTFAHGDLTPSQVLFDGPLSGLVDFDTPCVAEPALDLGQFTGYLALTARKAESTAGHPPGDRQAAVDEFFDAYLRAADVADPAWLRDRAAAFRAVTLTRVAVHSWRQLKPARLRLALGLLGEQRTARTGARS